MDFPSLIATLATISKEAEYTKEEDKPSLEMRLTRIYGIAEGTILGMGRMPDHSAERLALRLVRAEDTIQAIAFTDKYDQAVGLAEDYLRGL